ncbi:MAG: Lrp/AsnC ligand binding domain-containing protein [Candidatus Hodarchaeales archaeon]
MPLAFILLNSKIGTEHTVLDKIKSLEKNENIELHEVSVIYGVYDLIVKLSAKNMDELKEFITTKIRSLDEVSSSLTLIEVGQDDSDED